jgi:hypothetical protein
MADQEDKAQVKAHQAEAAALREKVKSIGTVKSGPKVHVSHHQGPLGRKQAPPLDNVAGIHLVHDDGRIDAVVGGHPDDAEYWEFKTRQLGERQQDPTNQTHPEVDE